MDTHMDTSIDIHMDMSMDIHMEMPIKSKVSEGKQARRIVYTIRARSLPRPAALEQQPECRRPDNQ